MFSKYAHKTARAEFFIRVSIRYKHVRDTIKWCNRIQQAWGPYVHGQTEPHFQVPALPVAVLITEDIVYISSHKRLKIFGRTYEKDSHLH